MKDVALEFMSLGAGDFILLVGSITAAFFWMFGPILLTVCIARRHATQMVKE
ncbi:hypothetical protein [Roseobacter sp.]|uniref:hypothetical protein n=1 Tax=Roseobacter sp. TaxID=1907202 RepID=UPI003299B60A